MTQTLRPVGDAVSLIRKRPEMYLAAAPPSGRELAARVASDALLLCATRVRTERQGPWWVISADVDWLARPPLDDPTELFFRIVPFPEGGVNSMRSEVLLTAFCDAVVTAEPAGSRTIVGSVPPSDPIWGVVTQVPQLKRVVAFRVAGEDR